MCEKVMGSISVRTQIMPLFHACDFKINIPSCFLLLLWFSEGKYDDALSLYTKAIELNPTVPAYYGNRSFCYIKTEYYGYALEDANKAIDLDKKYIKVS